MNLDMAFGNLVNDWGWLLIIGLVFGGGDIIGRILSGRGANTKLRAENKILKAQTKRSDQYLQQMLRQSGATVVTNPRHEALLWRVQATDTAVPQLPQELRADIDAVLAETPAIIQEDGS